MIDDWAKAWGVSPVAVADLRMRMLPRPGEATTAGASEAAVQAQVRLAAARAGVCLWRNNVGATLDAKGRMVRYGLANDSKALNTSVKSADLIGITPVLVTSAHLGTTVGVFTSVECKRGGWVYGGDDRERAQMRWAETVTALGGMARFAA